VTPKGHAELIASDSGMIESVIWTLGILSSEERIHPSQNPQRVGHPRDLASNLPPPTLRFLRLVCCCASCGTEIREIQNGGWRITWDECGCCWRKIMGW
jgi:hypothetical protein